MPKVHMICGPIGAGKTTYAIKLADEINAVRFSLDDWMRDLFFADMPELLNYEWAIERTQRCELQILNLSEKVLQTGIDVIWDLGLMEPDQRLRLTKQARDTGADVVAHALDAPSDIRYARVVQRNRDKPEGFVYEVPREMFDFMEDRTVNPNESEDFDELIMIDTSGDQ